MLSVTKADNMREMTRQTRLLIAGLIVALAVIALVFPSNPQTVAQPVTGQYTYTVTSQRSSNQQVFGINLPITLGVFTNSSVPQSIGSVTLSAGWVITVRFAGCTDCQLDIYEDWANGQIVIFSLFSEGSGIFVVPQDGLYDIFAINFGTVPERISQLTLFAVETTSSPVAQYGSYNYTAYSVQNVPPITTNPALSALLVIIAAVAALTIVMERRGRRPRRRRR
jgi:hypothetical protein